MTARVVVLQYLTLTLYRSQLGTLCYKMEFGCGRVRRPTRLDTRGQLQIFDSVQISCKSILFQSMLLVFRHNSLPLLGVLRIDCNTPLNIIVIAPLIIIHSVLRHLRHKIVPSTARIAIVPQEPLLISFAVCYHFYSLSHQHYLMCTNHFILYYLCIVQYSF